MTTNEQNDNEIEFSYLGTIKDRSVIGEICIIIYVTVWISSLLSPLILGFLLLNKYYMLSTMIIIIIMISYSPKSMDKYLCNLPLRNFFYRSFSKYYENISLGWIKGSKPCSQKNINDINNKNALPTLMCIHPHGIFTQSWCWLYLSPETVETTFMFSNALYLSPFFRLLARCSGRPGRGGPSCCDKITMTKHMKSKTNLAIVTGGFHEASIHSNKSDRVYLKSRKGFIKYAIQYGYSLTPIFGFGEKDTFYNVPGFWKLRLWLNNFGIPGILPFGRWICPILPRNKRLHIVIDKPLLPPQLKDGDVVTKEMVNEHHQKYVKKLESLYNKYSKIYYGKESNLEIW